MAQVDLFFQKGVFKVEAGGVRIKNISTGTYLDLQRGAAAENNPVIGYQYNGSNPQLVTILLVVYRPICNC